MRHSNNLFNRCCQLKISLKSSILAHVASPLMREGELSDRNRAIYGCNDVRCLSDTIITSGI